MSEILLLTQVGCKIRELRKMKKMTLNDLAEKCDFEKASLSRIETGKTNLTFRSLHKISEALEVKVVELFPEKELD